MDLLKKRGSTKKGGSAADDRRVHSEEARDDYEIAETRNILNIWQVQKLPKDRRLAFDFHAHASLTDPLQP
jgi:hypothetical protein